MEQARRRRKRRIAGNGVWHPTPEPEPPGYAAEMSVIAQFSGPTFSPRRRNPSRAGIDSCLKENCGRPIYGASAPMIMTTREPGMRASMDHHRRGFFIEDTGKDQGRSANGSDCRNREVIRAIAAKWRAIPPTSFSPLGRPTFQRSDHCDGLVPLLWDIQSRSSFSHPSPRRSPYLHRWMSQSATSRMRSSDGRRASAAQSRADTRRTYAAISK